MAAPDGGRTCYSCQHELLCRMRASVHESIRHNLDMVDVDAQTSSPRSWIRVFDTLAQVCKEFKPRDV